MSESSEHPLQDAAPPVTRRPLHRRRIEMCGFERSDGLYEIEARLLDTKTDYLPRPFPGQPVPAGEPVHQLGLRLVYDSSMLVHAVETFIDRAPYPACPESGRALQAICGLRMQSGWVSQVNALLKGAASCTHLRELLMPMATTAHQTLGAFRLGQPTVTDASGRPVMIDSCYAYAADGQVVAQFWPAWSQAGKAGD